MRIGNLIIAGRQQIQKALTQTALTLASQINLVKWRGPEYVNYSLAKSFERAFTENAIFFSVVDKIGDKFAHIPRYVMSPTASRQRVEGELQDLLDNPNDYQGQDQFFYLVALSYKACGEVFIWKNRGGSEGGKPLELYVLPPWTIAPVSDGNLFGVSHYLLTVEGTDKRIEKEDVIHWKKPGLSLESLRGFSILVPARKLITQEDSITDASVSMYQQGGAKGVLYNKTLDNLTDGQRDEIKAVVDKKINNSDVKGAVATIQGDWGYLNVGLSSVDMDLLKAEEAVIKKIMFVLGYPYEMFGGDATHANREQSMNYLLTQTIAPMVASFDAELNRSLLPDFAEKGKITSDMSELPEMQQMRLKTAISIATMDYISRNEKRELGGWEPRKEPEMDRITVASGQVFIEDLGIGDPMQQGDNGGY